jgi:hypothetical protein
MRVVILFFFILAFSACKAGLSKEEKAFTSELAAKYQCKVCLHPDRAAIKAHRHDGELRIELQNSKLELCNTDSTKLKSLASDITAQLLKIVQHRENYSTVEVLFYFYHEVKSTAQERFCSKRILVNANDVNQANILEYTAPRE